MHISLFSGLLHPVFDRLYSMHSIFGRNGISVTLQNRNAVSANFGLIDMSIIGRNGFHNVAVLACHYMVMVCSLHTFLKVKGYFNLGYLTCNWKTAQDVISM